MHFVVPARVRVGERDVAEVDGLLGYVEGARGWGPGGVVLDRRGLEVEYLRSGDFGRGESGGLAGGGSAADEGG